MKKTEVAFIGCGGISQIHMQALSKIPEVLIAAVYDKNHSKALELAGKSDIQIFQNENEMLKSDIDCFYVCTTHDSHYRLTKKILLAGKNVFCEKPLTMKSKNAQELIKIATEMGVVLFVGLNFRFAPAVTKVKKICVEENITPVIINLSMISPPFLKNWAGLDDIGGGILHCLGTHAFDLISNLAFSDIAEISCFAERYNLPDNYLDDSAVAVCKLTNGGIASVTITDLGSKIYSESLDNLFSIEIIGKEKKAFKFSLTEVNCVFNEEIKQYSYADNSKIVNWGYYKENELFIKAVNLNNNINTYKEEGFKATKYVEMAKMSIENSRPISFKEI